MSEDNIEAQYKDALARRDAHTGAILASDARKIVVVAGPGTGKTTLFAEVLKKKGGNTLTLSFINALVDDLSLGLFGLSDVKTLHGFSAGVLQKETNAKIYPKLSDVIRQDAAILLGEAKVDFDRIFHQGTGDERHIDFYKKRKDYYGRYYGFADAIFGLVRYLQTNKHKIPEFSQIVVDEFQDFNESEVALIELLAEKSPILLAGDDDQSLYVELKNASPHHIRERHGEKYPAYAPFSLPFCSRSTRVVVEAANDVVTSAISHGLLKGRVSKPYDYFPCAKKDAESKANPSIVYTQQFEGEMANFIRKQICEAAMHEREKFSVLVVMPPQLKKVSLPKLAKTLRKQGFKNVTHADRKRDREPTVIDGLKILLKERDDNLGWRIVAKHMVSSEEFEALVKKASGTERVSSLLHRDMRAKTMQLVRTLKKIRDGKSVQEPALKEFMALVGYDPYELASHKLREDLLADDSIAYDAPRGVRGIPIVLTTIPSSKGLAGDYVFITHFDDQYYTESGKGTVSDREVIAFLVALTRARKKAILISSKDKAPVLLHWIDQARIDSRLDAPHTKRSASET